MIRIIQVGMGGWGRDWARTVLPHVPEVDPVAFVDMSAEVLAAAQIALRGCLKRSCGGKTTDH
jgi:hypothetical protein